ncbi:putative toxin [Haliangium sp.]|uniref:putative toxin n=1 Tax=Haliangium sp. TaxID=2663208 RepID=UPI003D0DD68E
MPRSARLRCGLRWGLVGLLLLITAHARADSPIALKAGATTPQSELTSPGMTLGGSLSGPRWRPLSGLVLAPHLELFLARRHTGLVPDAGDRSYTLDFFEVPLLVRAELMLGGRSFYAMAGGVGSLVLRADETSAQGLMSPANMASRYDVGLLAAGGLSLASSSWGELSAEVRYQQGSRSLLPQSAQKHRVLSLLLGYGLGADDSVDAPSLGSSDRWLTLKGGLVATRFQPPGTAASSFASGFSFGGAFAPARFGSSVALVPQVELAFVHRGEHHGVTPAGALSLDDVDVSALVRGEAPIAGRALYGLAGVYGSVLIRAQRSLDGAITPMRDAVRAVDAGWLAGAGVAVGTLGDATLSLEVRYQRGLFDRLSAPEDAATLHSLTWALGITYGAPSTRPGTSEFDPTALYGANDQGDGNSAQRGGRTVSVRMGRVGDRWLQDLPCYEIARARRDDEYGYQATYYIAGRGKQVFFWARSDIDFDDRTPEGYRGKALALEEGRVLYPTRVTSQSLPDVHRGILYLERIYAGQADGAIAAMDGFTLVAGLGDGAPALRRAAPRESGLTVGRHASHRSATRAVTSGTGTARQLGQAGEAAAGIVKNTERIASLTGTARYRVPDVLDHAARVIGEVKNVSRLSYTKQLRDFVAYAQHHRYTFYLWVRTTTQLSVPLQQAVRRGQIILRFLP